MGPGQTEAEWRELLAEMNKVVLGCELQEELPPEVLARGWLGEPPATEEAIVAAELRLGMTLPPSFKAFYRVANGWHWPHPNVRMILPVERIERLAASNTPDIVAWRKASGNANIAALLSQRLNKFLNQKQEDSASDQLRQNLAEDIKESSTHFLDTDDLKLAAMIEISLEQWPISRVIILLNPLAVSPDGEMQTTSSAKWKESSGTFWQFMMSGRDELARRSISGP